MKRMIKAASGYKRHDINIHEYDNAVKVGKQVLFELHSRYPEVFPIGTTRSIRRKSAWSSKLYVYVDTGLRWRDIGNHNDVFDFSKEWTEVIRQDILPDLGINKSEFEVGLDEISNGYRISIVVYDLLSNSEVK